MTWTSFHRRGDVLRDVIAAADQRRDGVLPRDVAGVSRDLRRRPRPPRRPPAEVAHPPRRPDRARADAPADGPARGRRARLAGRPPTSCPASGPSSTASGPRPPTTATAAIMRKSAAKEHVLLAVMAGLASAHDARAAAVGARHRGRGPGHLGRRTSRAPDSRPGPTRPLARPAEGGARGLTSGRTRPAGPGARHPPSLPVPGPGSSYVCDRCVMMASWSTGRPRCAPGCCSWPRPQLLDPNFADTVVLMLDVDEDGALGVVLNRPSPVPVAEVLETLGRDRLASPRCCSAAARSAPRARWAWRCCATATTCRSGSARSTGCSGWSTSTPRSSWSTAAWPACGSSPATPAGAPSSWPRRSRRAAGTSSRARPSTSFRLDPAELWRDVLRRQPGELAWHSTRPVDPELN